MVKDEFDRLNTRIAQLERELDDASNELMTMQSKPEYQYAFDNGVRSVEWMVKHAQELRNSIADTDPNIMSDRELVEQPGKLKAQLDEYKKKAELYEIVRRMNPIAFKLMSTTILKNASGTNTLSAPIVLTLVISL